MSDIVPVVHLVTRFLFSNVWLCGDVNKCLPSVFNHDYPPILVANIKPFSKRDEEDYEATPPHLRDLKRIIRVRCQKYA